MADPQSTPTSTPTSATQRDETPQPQAPTTPERPVTPTHKIDIPQTPEISITGSASKQQQPPRTPLSSRTPTANSLYPPSAVSNYLSSPVRRRKNFQDILRAGTMTPGRPSLNYTVPSPSPYKVSKKPLNGSSTPGQVRLNSTSVPNLPLQTLFLTEEQIASINDLEVCKKTLKAAIEQSEQYKRSAQQFRSIANNHLFQLNLMQIEHDETQQRHEVEANIQKREIEKLMTDSMGHHPGNGFNNDYENNHSDHPMKSNNHNMNSMNMNMNDSQNLSNRIKEMSALLEAKDVIIADLRRQLDALNHEKLQALKREESLKELERSQVKGIPQPHPPHQHQQQSHHQQPSANLHSSPNTGPKTPANFSALEVLASQVLSSGIHSDEISPTRQNQVHNFSSPYESPYRPSFSTQSPYPQPPFANVASTGSPSKPKERRPSSSSTISAPSEDDTLEEASV